MRKQIVPLTLLALLFVSCGKTDDSVTSSSADTSTGKISESSAADTGKKTDDEKKDSEIAKDALFVDLKSGVTAFMEDNHDMTYEYVAKSSYKDPEEHTESTTNAKSTFNGENGLLYFKLDTLDKDYTSNTEEVDQDEKDYFGIMNNEYRKFYSYLSDDSEKHETYKADKYAANYAHKRYLWNESSDYMESICNYIVNSKDLSTLGSIINYVHMECILDYRYDIEKTNSGIVFSFEGTQNYSDSENYYEYRSECSVVVKDGFVSEYHYSTAYSTEYPDKTVLLETESIDMNIKGSFDESFYKSFFGTYPSEAATFYVPVEIYYEDYYYSTVYMGIGENISGDSDNLNSDFDGLYFDKDCTIPYTAKKYSSDVRKMYLKLKTEAGSTYADIYTLTERTYLYYGIDYPSNVGKSIKVETITNIVYNLPWKYSVNKESALEKMYVNGVETTEKTFDVTMGEAYVVRHTFSSYALRG